MAKKKNSFSGSLGFVLAAAGSAVGVGNIWRFPYLCAKDGGGLFLLVYLVLVLTFLLTVIFDLVVAIEVGMLLAALLFMKRMSDETEVRGWKYKDMPEDQLTEVPLHVRVYEIRGPLFFGMADHIGEITVKEFTRCLVIRMHMVNALDVTALNALEALYDECAKKGVRVIFSHVNEQPLHVMERAGFVDKVGRENFCDHIQQAIALASQQ